MTGYVDFHTHAFPDSLAQVAIPFLEKEGDVTAHLNGTTSALLASMDQADIAVSIVGSIATRVGQFTPILAWSEAIRSDRLVPFPSFHPDDPAALARIDQISAKKFKGVKLHPYYQQFVLDEERMLPLYERLCEKGLIVLMHTGFDIAFPRDPIASPARFVRVMERFPELKLIASHLGAWEQWEEVNELIAGRPFFMDISYTLDQIDRELAREILERHPADFLLFGSDSPWAGQRETIDLLRGFGLGEEKERKILRDNGLRLLNPVG